MKRHISDLGHQLRQYRERQKMSQKALSQVTGIEQATISRIERGEQQLVSPHVATLASSLGLQVWNTFDSNGELVALDGDLVRLWPQEEVARIASLPDAEQRRETRRHIMSARKHSPGTFAITLADDSMTPRFKRSDIVIVDRGQRPEIGNFVVAASQNEPAGVFGQYASRGKDRSGNRLFEIVPLNTLYSGRRSDTDVLKILGVAVEKIEIEL